MIEIYPNQYIYKSSLGVDIDYKIFFVTGIDNKVNAVIVLALYAYL